MKVKYIGKKKMDFIVPDNEMALIPGKIYETLPTTNNLGWYRIIDESGEDYGYPPEFFEVVEN